jgi:hypothetical protein
LGGRKEASIRGQKAGEWLSEGEPKGEVDMKPNVACLQQEKKNVGLKTRENIICLVYFKLTVADV